MLARLARSVTRHPWRVVLTFLVATAAAVPAAATIGGALVATGLQDEASGSAEVDRLLEERFGTATPEIVAVVGDAAAPLPPDRAQVVLGELAERLRSDPAVVSVRSPFDPGGERLRSVDGARWMLLVDVDDALDGGEAFERLEAVLRAVDAPVLLGGELPAEEAARSLALEDLRRAELIALPLAGVLLLVFFRGPWAALLPLVSGGVAVALTLAALHGLARLTPLSVFVLNLATFLGTGLTIDYALLLVQRFRDERTAGRSPPGAVAEALRTSGRAVLVSGFAVAGSLLALLLFPLVLMRSVAIAGAVVVLCTLLSSLVLLPALMVLLGERLGQSRDGEDGHHDGWGRLAAWVLRHRVAVVVASLAVLVPLALPLRTLRTTSASSASLPAEVEARQVDQLLTAGAFGPDLRNPVVVVARTDGPVLSPDGAAAMATLVERLGALPGVIGVESPFAVGPLADPRLAAALLASPERMPPELAAALDRVVDRDLTVLRVVAPGDRHGPASEALVDRLRGLDVPGVRVLVGGETARDLDARRLLTRRAAGAAALVVVVDVLVLFLAFGSVVVPISAVLANVASLAASFGVLVWIFQQGNLSDLLRFTPPGGLDPTVPIVLFAIVFGLSMDYEVFLLSRVREAYDATGDPQGSVVVGLERTGRVITRAAALLVVVVLGFALGRFLFVQELGLGMALAILLDVTLVRGLLVPATLSLLGKATWWSPPVLARWWRRLGVVGPEG